MRNLIFTLILLSAVFTGHANNHETVFKNLMNVNAEWKNQTDAMPWVMSPLINQPTSFNDWIAIHLMLVEKTLRNRNVSHLSSSQKQNRLKLLNELNGYWKAETFPTNDYLLCKNPVFIDRKGTHCAVGYLMMQSGHDDLAKRIDANEKFAYVRQIKTEGVKAWADENGFTVDELAWIQPGYPPLTTVVDMEGGLNGPVNTIAVDGVSQTVYAAGSFSTTGEGVVCNNIAAYISGIAGYDWIAVGSGVNGTVHAMVISNNKIYVGGEFTMAGSTVANHIAVYDISTGQWSALGSLDSTVRALVFYNNELYAGGNFTGFVSKWNGTQWTDVTAGFIYGEGVHALHVFNNELVIGGNFECATGALRTHIATYNGSYMGTLGFGTVTPVNDLETHNGILFAACNFVSGNDTCALASYENGDWITRIKSSNEISSFFAGNAINTLVSANGLLLAGGDFDCGSGMTYGNNLAQLSKAQWGDTTLYDCMPLTITDEKVNSLAASFNTLYFGGNFSHAGMGDTANHIAYLQLTATGIKTPHENSVSINVFPNPASSHIRVEANENISQIQVTDINGHQILTDKSSTTSKEVSIAQLPGGVYFVRVLTKHGWSNIRFLKY